MDDLLIYTEEISDELGKQARKYETLTKAVESVNTHQSRPGLFQQFTPGETVMILLAVVALFWKA